MTGDIDPWLLWTIFFSSILIFISLWMITFPVWHLLVSLFTLLILWIGSPSPLKTLAFILGLVAFLALLQIVFSSFMRDMFFRSMESGFMWSDWQYLLFAVERFAFPLVIVSAFKTQLTSLDVITHLTGLLLPLKWLGLKIDKLQTLILLALRFMPSLQREWERFSHFQTYFVSGLPQKTLIQKLAYWQGVFKAMIAHTIHRAVKTGDLLALRGLPVNRRRQIHSSPLKPLLIWIVLGCLCYFLDVRMLIVWSGMSVWLGMVAFSGAQGEIA